MNGDIHLKRAKVRALKYLYIFVIILPIVFHNAIFILPLLKNIIYSAGRVLKITNFNILPPLFIIIRHTCTFYLLS
jgi:hypothetical protein